MAFIDKVLQVPSYGWMDKNEKLVTPSALTLFKEAFSRINIFKSKKNWMPFFSWSVTICLFPFFIAQLIYFAWHRPCIVDRCTKPVRT